MAKGEIARFEQFLILSRCFQKSSAADASTCVYRWERVKMNTNLKIYELINNLNWLSRVHCQETHSHLENQRFRTVVKKCHYCG